MYASKYPGATNFDVTDCDLLESSITPTCSFKRDPWLAPGSIADQAVLDAGGALTISFWIRPQAKQASASFRPSLTIFSSIAPP